MRLACVIKEEYAQISLAAHVKHYTFMAEISYL